MARAFVAAFLLFDTAILWAITVGLPVIVFGVYSPIGWIIGALVLALELALVAIVLSRRRRRTPMTRSAPISREPQ